MIDIFFKLIIGHALADFSLQSDAMAKGKNRHNKPDFIPTGQKLMPCWMYWLSAHALINAGTVWFATGFWYLGLGEFIVHWITDFLKCDNYTNPNIDQAIHFISKLLWLGLAVGTR